MPAYALGLAVPAVDADDAERHDCCCEHVVATLEAMPAPADEQYRIARERYVACPHHELTPLEVWLGVHWNWKEDRAWQ